jgi:hypothetical protein
VDASLRDNAASNKQAHVETKQCISNLSHSVGLGFNAFHISSMTVTNEYQHQFTAIDGKIEILTKTTEDRKTGLKRSMNQSLCRGQDLGRED